MSNDRTSLAIRRLQEIMATLRGPGGCPWDARQTPESLKPYLIEEAYEVLQAIDRGNPEAICEELGDLLLQIVFHARIFEERGKFDFGRVAESIADKLLRRHPHVFAGQPENDLDILARRWEELKKEEKPAQSRPFGDIPGQLPALLRARKVTSKAVRSEMVRLDAATVTARIRRQVEVLLDATGEDDRNDRERQMGDLLLSLAGLGHFLGIEPEESLRMAINRFCQMVDQTPSAPG